MLEVYFSNLPDDFKLDEAEIEALKSKVKKICANDNLSLYKRKNTRMDLVTKRGRRSPNPIPDGDETIYVEIYFDHWTETQYTLIAKEIHEFLSLRTLKETWITCNDSLGNTTYNNGIATKKKD